MRYAIYAAAIIIIILVAEIFITGGIGSH